MGVAGDGFGGLCDQKVGLIYEEFWVLLWG